MNELARRATIFVIAPIGLLLLLFGMVCLLAAHGLFWLVER